MRTSKFTVEQISSAPRRTEAGIAVAEICRELGITEITFYRWKRKHRGVGTPELCELPQLRDENRKLKQVVADLRIDSGGCCALPSRGSGSSILRIPSCTEG